MVRDSEKDGLTEFKRQKELGKDSTLIVQLRFPKHNFNPGKNIETEKPAEDDIKT